MSKAQDWNLLARDAVTLTTENISRLVKGLPFKAKLALRGLLRMQHGSRAAPPGGVPERPIGTALKAVAGSDVSRGFESRPLCYSEPPSSRDTES